MVGRRGESKVFFPWERRRGLFGVLGRARVRLVAFGIAAIALTMFVRAREERAAGVRATRATITSVRRAVSAYRADHGGNCPRELTELTSAGYTTTAAIDAWGRPLRLACPGRRDPRTFDVISDGPDGEPLGLDRVE